MVLKSSDVVHAGDQRMTPIIRHTVAMKSPRVMVCLLSGFTHNDALCLSKCALTTATVALGYPEPLHASGRAHQAVNAACAWYTVLKVCGHVCPDARVKVHACCVQGTSDCQSRMCMPHASDSRSWGWSL